MMLGEAMEQIPKDTTVSIGSLTGFFWIGTAEDFLICSKQVDEFLTKQNKSTMAQLEYSIKSLTPGKAHKIPAAIEFMCDKRPNVVLESWDYEVNRVDARIAKERRWRTAWRLLTELDSIMERRVREIYEKTVYDPGIAIIVEGEETCQFWFAEEFDLQKGVWMKIALRMKSR